MNQGLPTFVSQNGEKKEFQIKHFNNRDQLAKWLTLLLSHSSFKKKHKSFKTGANLKIRINIQ